MLGFYRAWVVAQRPPTQPDVVVAIGYGSLQGELMKATTESTQKAAEMAKRYPNAVIAYGNSSHCFPGSDLFEDAEKSRLLDEQGISAERRISAGAITNTVTEAQAIKRALDARGIAPREVLLITERFHGHGVLWIWKRIFPGVRLSLLHVHASAYQPDALVWLQRGKLRWLIANVARQVALTVFGLGFVSKVKHPT